MKGLSATGGTGTPFTVADSILPQPNMVPLAENPRPRGLNLAFALGFALKVPNLIQTVEIGSCAMFCCSVILMRQ